VVVIGLLPFLLGCGSDPTDLDAPLVLQPSELCSDHSDDAIPTFEHTVMGDATLEAVNRSEEIDSLGVPIGLTPVHNDLTCGLISGLAQLVA
jgi:hypothetical protein